ncbi:MAG: hypothetical protein WDN31_06040 [Hyphomicrobium sp.]
MIKARMRKAQRLLDVQQDLQRLEEERIAGLKRRQAELAALQEETIGALGDDGGPQGLFISVIVKRLKALAEEALRVDEDLQRRSRALRALATRTKYAERLVRNYEQQHDKVVAERDLMDVIERALRIDDASLP